MPANVTSFRSLQKLDEENRAIHRHSPRPVLCVVSI
jgi:hypothetical protein